MINAMLCDKDYQGFIANIGNKIDYYIASKISNENKSLCPKLLTNMIANFTTNYDKSNNLQQAIDLAITKIRQYKRNNDEYQILLIITGSLYFAGEFLLGDR
jgi:folylpolyglutamate synthase/dihydropteroate synthase